jgi:hypothetical protein
MNQPARAPILCRLGYLVAVLAVGTVPNRAAAEVQLLPDLPAAAPIAPTTPPAPPSPVETAKPIEAEVGLRLDLRVQNPLKPDQLDDASMNSRFEVLISGSINSVLKWQGGFIGTLGTADREVQAGSNPAAVDGKAAVLELIARLELHDAFKIWAGRLLVPADRAGLSTEWSMAPWLFPGQFASTLRPVGARQGQFGRSDGATLWGNLYGGTFKYYVGVYNLGDPDLAPLTSGRLSLSLLGAEPGYRIASSYYGSKDVLTLGVGVQHQQDGSTHVRTDKPTEGVDAWDDFTEVNIDLLFEKNMGAAGVLDVEGAFYRIWGHYEPETWTAFALVSYLLPIEVGWGRFQPLFRLQRAAQRDKDGNDTLADAQLGYIIDGARARAILGYRYSKVAGQEGNALLLGVQLLSR